LAVRRRDAAGPAGETPAFRPLPSANASNDAPAIAAAAIPAALHDCFNSTVGTCGFGGRLYCRASPRTIKNACVPPTLVSFGFQIVASSIPFA
jgi:hypothetical protein